ncbi:MAG: hypothetical protein PVJ33_06545 [Lysobacterales bacterium]
MTLKQVTTTTFCAALAMTGLCSNTWAGAEHNVFPFSVDDYNDCTEEVVQWDATVYETFLSHESSGGQVVSSDHWVWEAVVEGDDTGFVWYTKGVGQFVDTYSLDNSRTGGMFIERSVLRPQTPGAPKIRLDAHIFFQYNASGELVVDNFDYVYNCIGH